MTVTVCLTIVNGLWTNIITPFATSKADIYISGDGNLASPALINGYIITIENAEIMSGIKNANCSDIETWASLYFALFTDEVPIYISPPSKFFR